MSVYQVGRKPNLVYLGITTSRTVDLVLLVKQEE